MGGKGGRCVGLTTLPPLCVSLPPGAKRACSGLYMDCFAVTFLHLFHLHCNYPLSSVTYSQHLQIFEIKTPTRIITD